MQLACHNYYIIINNFTIAIIAHTNSDKNLLRCLTILPLCQVRCPYFTGLFIHIYIAIAWDHNRCPRVSTIAGLSVYIFQVFMHTNSNLGECTNSKTK